MAAARAQRRSLLVAPLAHCLGLWSVLPLSLVKREVEEKVVCWVDCHRSLRRCQSLRVFHDLVLLSREVAVESELGRLAGVDLGDGRDVDGADGVG